MKSKNVKWPKQGNNSTNVSRENLCLEMRAYADSKGYDVRSARKYLRSVGLNISYKGNIIINDYSL